MQPGSSPTLRPPQSLMTMRYNPSPKALIKLPFEVPHPVAIRHLPPYSPTPADTISQNHNLVTSTASVGVPQTPITIHCSNRNLRLRWSVWMMKHCPKRYGRTLIGEVLSFNIIISSCSHRGGRPLGICKTSLKLLQQLLNWFQNNYWCLCLYPF